MPPFVIGGSEYAPYADRIRRALIRHAVTPIPTSLQLNHQPRPFDFLALPPEVQQIIVDALYQYPWMAEDRHIERRTPTNLTLPIAPLLVSRHFRRMADFAMTQIHAGHYLVEFTHFQHHYNAAPQFFDNGISSVSSSAWQEDRPFFFLRSLMHRFPNLQTIDCGGLTGFSQNVLFQNTTALIRATTLLDLLTQQNNTRIAQQALTEMNMILQTDGPIPGNTTLRWAIPSPLTEIHVPFRFDHSVPEDMSLADIWVHFELRGQNCRVTDIDATIPLDATLPRGTNLTRPQRWRGRTYGDGDMIMTEQDFDRLVEHVRDVDRAFREMEQEDDGDEDEDGEEDEDEDGPRPGMSHFQASCGHTLWGLCKKILLVGHEPLDRRTSLST